MAEKWGASDHWYTLMPQKEIWQAESLVQKDDGRLHHLSIMRTCQPCLAACGRRVHADSANAPKVHSKVVTYTEATRTKNRTPIVSL
ncbi:unnamed protein product [Pleuronectes platessa]|uniref:Uncharacterized protein n=1 Tax=Pleuronectes platessa TaxID=8262 RepID=A0A9N7U4B6_PLEPL|nr:unnamed protein product [Pleuronectes platessa]